MNTEFKHVPSGWKLSTVGRECKICNNLREPLSEEERATMQGSYPYYGPTKAVDYLDHFRVEGTFALIGEDGDHFLKYNNQDMTQLVCGRFNVNNHAHIVKGGPDCSTEWFYTFFRQRSIAPFLTRQGAGRFKLNKATLEKIPFLVPPIAEQEAIHSAITKWDRSIDLTERLIASKQERRTWLMQQLLTGKRRLPGFDGEWREVNLRDIFERVQRSIPDGENPEVLSITAKVGFVSQREKFSKVIAGKNLEQYVLIRKGEFSYNKGNSLTYPQGCVFRLKEFEEGAVPNVFLSFRAASSEVFPEFYSHFFASGGLNHQLSRVINTGVRNDGLLNLNASDFFNVKVPFPSVAEQEQIAKTLTLANAELDLLRSQLDALREQKKGLMQQLLTGKLRVKSV